LRKDPCFESVVRAEESTSWSFQHQVLSDGWSFGVIANELAALYDAFSRGMDSPLAPLSIQFADFAFWQRRWQSHPDMIAQLTYWREQLRDPLPGMKLAKGAAPRR
jgi:hypothetical protein